MLSIIPGIGALISGIFIYFYKLDDKKVKAIEMELDQRRLAEGKK
jgi:glycoside/pentoside/hexuronide:cation symporter, GPH family